MTSLTFDIEKLARAAQHALAAPQHTYGHDVLFQQQYHRAGKFVEQEGWPDKADIDPQLITPALILVMQEGVFFMSNGVPQLAPDDASKVYARECDPKNLAADECYNVARAIFGKGDTEITLFGWPQAVLDARARGAIAVRVQVTTEAVALVPVYSSGSGDVVFGG